jgi:hypothetical protein
MSELLTINAVFVYMCLWALGLVMMWLRGRIELGWKLIASAIFLFYIILLNKELQTGYERFMADAYIQTMHFLKEFVMYLFSSIFFLWPLSLIVVFYKSSDYGSEKLLKFMCVLTLVLLVIGVIYAYHSHDIDTFLFKNFRKLFDSVK